MKKEENLDLIKKLASTKADTGLLKSSRDLGVTKLPKREVLARALDETDAGVNVEQNRGLLFEENINGAESSSGSHSDSGEHDSGPRSGFESDEAPTSTQVKGRPEVAMVGSGLKRPLEFGMDGTPMIKRRKRRNDSRPHPTYEIPETEVSSWDGFSAAGSINDEASTFSTDSSKMSGTGSEDDESESSHSDGSDNAERKRETSAFGAWARSQINEAVGFTPSVAQTLEFSNSSQSRKHNGAPKDPSKMAVNPLPPETSTQSADSTRKSQSITISRSESVQASRMDLPIAAEEQRIMEAVYENPTVIISGETGSGKTTQVPQFLYEAGFGNRDGSSSGMIGITQPRRVAAISMASRVAHELGDDHASRVAHQVRFDSSVSPKSAIKFMTDGILLREIATDLALTKYSAIVVDEAHERSMNTDVLIGFLSRIVDLREEMRTQDKTVKPLKLIIMSATLRLGDFVDNKVLFKNGPPPLVEVEGRQHPVTMHFARRTQADYVEQAYQKVCRAHRRLPPGAMLVFMTSQDEITLLIRRLKEDLATSKNNSVLIDGNNSETSEDEADEFATDDLTGSSQTPNVHLLPLYSQLQTREQLRVFEAPPDGCRLIVVATNVAETSLTIPGVRYVFDCGRVKEKKYDDVSGVQSFEVGWISKASAGQRAGRAGRTGPGHCYRLFSSAVYERDFAEHAEPEILRMPVDGVVLQLKSMEVHNVTNFPFPSPPDRKGLARAESLLKALGTLTKEGRITDTGNALTKHPIAPRYAKILAVGHQYKCMALTIILVAALATPNLFVPERQLGLLQSNEEALSQEEQQEQEALLKKKREFNHTHHLMSRLSRTSDALKLFNALQSYIKADDKEYYCHSMFLTAKAMHEARSLVDHLTSTVQNNSPLQFSDSTPQKASPSKDQIAALQQFTAAGFLDQIAILASESPSPPYVGRNPKRSSDVPYLPLFPIDSGRRTADSEIHDIAVYAHPSSVLAHLAVKEMPKYIIYSHLQRVGSSTVGEAKTKRTRMHALTAVTERTIIALAGSTPLLEYGKPLKIVEEGTDARGKTRTCIVQPNLVGPKGSMGWPLPAQKVFQIRNEKGEWIVQ